VLPICSVTFVPFQAIPNPRPQSAYNKNRRPMKFLESIAEAFIMTFGITPPTPERKRIAALFIGSSLFLTAAGIVILFIAVIVHLKH
jgi:hypothetical protein